MKNWISILALPLVLSACVAPKLNVHDTQAMTSAIEVKRDDFKKLTEYIGPNVAKDLRDTVAIRAWKFDKDNQVSYQIYVADFYRGSWRLYNQAHDSNGKFLESSPISRDVVVCSGGGDCSYVEHLGLKVTREYLEQNKESGILFKLSGKGGEEIFYISGSYIMAMLTFVK